MTKTQVKVEITTFGSFSKTADDAAVAGQGTAAYNAIQGQRDVLIDGTFIPFKAIDHAVVTITQAEETAPDDATCPRAN